MGCGTLIFGLRGGGLGDTAVSERCDGALAVLLIAWRAGPGPYGAPDTVRAGAGLPPYSEDRVRKFRQVHLTLGGSRTIWRVLPYTERLPDAGRPSRRLSRAIPEGRTAAASQGVCMFFPTDEPLSHHGPVFAIPRYWGLHFMR